MPIAAPVPVTPTPVGEPFALALQTYPKLAAWLAKNAKARKVNGQPMTVEQYSAWILAGQAKLR